MPPASFDPVLHLLQRYTIAISALIHMPPTAVPDLPWWQLEDAMDLVDAHQREARRNG